MQQLSNIFCRIYVILMVKYILILTYSLYVVSINIPVVYVVMTGSLKLTV